VPYATTYNFTLQENTMNTLRQLCAALVLTLMIALSTSAGDMHTTVAPPQPAPTPAEAQGNIHTGAPGDIHTTEATAAEVLAGAVVDLVQGVLALL
jgi:hypothetical protein